MVSTAAGRASENGGIGEKFAYAPGTTSSAGSPRILQITSNVGHKSLERGKARDVAVFVRAVHELCNVGIVRKNEYINDLLHIFEGLSEVDEARVRGRVVATVGDQEHQ